MTAVSANYRIPVQVNGFECKSCTDVDYARRHIDPQHPKSGPYNVDANVDPSRSLDRIGNDALSVTGALLNASA